MKAGSVLPSPRDTASAWRSKTLPRADLMTKEPAARPRCPTTAAQWRFFRQTLSGTTDFRFAIFIGTPFPFTLGSSRGHRAQSPSTESWFADTAATMILRHPSRSGATLAAAPASRSATVRGNPASEVPEPIERRRPQSSLIGNESLMETRSVASRVRDSQVPTRFESSGTGSLGSSHA